MFALGPSAVREVSRSPAPSKDVRHNDAVRGQSRAEDETREERALSLTEQAAAALEASLNDPQHGLQGEAEREKAERILYPDAARLAVIIASLCMGSFLITLDMTIVPIAIPKITDAFASMADVGWYASTNMLVLCSFMPMFGKIFAYFDEKWTYVTVLVIFECGSLISGLARSSAMFIFGRAIAGLGAAGIWVGYNIIIVHSVPLHRRAFYTGLVGSMYGLASIVGPIAGGLFADDKRLTWRWCFFINLPIGAAAMLAVVLFFKTPSLGKSRHMTFHQKVNKLDFRGMAFFIPSVLCLLFALQWGGVRYNWGNARIIVLFVLSFLCFVVFAILQVQRGALSTIPPHIIRQRSMYASFVFTFSISGAFFLLIYYVPIWFQSIQGTSAFQTGVRNMPLKVSVIITTLLAGGLVSSLGYYKPFMIGSAVMLAISSGLLTTLHKDTNKANWIGFQLMAGLGLGMGQQQGLMAAQTVLDDPDVPVGIAVIMFGQLLGGAITVSVGQNVFYNRLIQELARNVPSLKDSKHLVTSIGATRLKATIQSLDPGLVGPVEGIHNAAITQSFYISVAMSILALIAASRVEWRSMRAKPSPAAVVV